MQSRPTPAEKRIFRENPHARLLLALAIAAGFLAAACVVVQAVLLSRVVDDVFLNGGALQENIPWLALMLALALARAVFIWGENVLAQRSSSRLKSSLRRRLLAHLFDLGPAYTRSQRSGELVNTLSEGVEVLDDYVTSFLPARTLAGLVPLLVLVVVLALDPPSALILVFTGVILILELILVGGRAREITERRFVELSWMSAFFLDMLQGLATLKLFGRSREQVENIREISQRYGDTTMEVLRTAFQTGLVLEWGGTIATALVAVQVSLRLMNGWLPFERALAVLVLTPEFFIPLRQLAIRFHSGTAGKTAAGRVFSILDAAPHARGAVWEGAPEMAHPVPLGGGDIRFERISFSYRDGEVDSPGERAALRDVSLEIRQGESVALVGATGAGKSTIASLLLRFIEPDAGQITVAGAPLSEIEPKTWRAQVAWVPQLPHLFYGSVGDNLFMARPGATRDEMVAAARAAHIHDFIQTLPQGYGTPVGEGGARLSGGQKQRIAIARAFLKDAPILILDEATSHLDAASEAAIREGLESLMRGRTVLVIAHRLALALAASKVIVLDDGQVVEVGQPQALLAQGGYFRRLVDLYQGSAATDEVFE